MILQTDMTSFLLTEIALDLLGNKFYTIDGEHVRDLQTLYKLTHDEAPTGEPSLTSFLCISETSLRAADNLESSVIVLDDDEGDGNENTSVSLDDDNTEESQDCQEIEIDSLPSSEEEFSQPSLQDTGPNSRELSTEGENCSQSSSSAPQNAKINTPSTQNLPRNKPWVGQHLYRSERDYKSDDQNERLAFIMEASVEEYKRMNMHSTKLKKSFIDTNQALITLRSLKEEDFLRRFYMQQKISLIEESNSLMQFIKIVKNEEGYSKDVLGRVAGDILKAKDMIS